MLLSLVHPGHAAPSLAFPHVGGWLILGAALALVGCAALRAWRTRHGNP
jgi:hypothetical protein